MSWISSAANPSPSTVVNVPSSLFIKTFILLIAKADTLWSLIFKEPLLFIVISLFTITSLWNCIGPRISEESSVSIIFNLLIAIGFGVSPSGQKY